MTKRNKELVELLSKAQDLYKGILKNPEGQKEAFYAMAAVAGFNMQIKLGETMSASKGADGMDR